LINKKCKKSNGYKMGDKRRKKIGRREGLSSSGK
jgi:hypothetical protein